MSLWKVWKKHEKIIPGVGNSQTLALKNQCKFCLEYGYYFLLFKDLEYNKWKNESLIISKGVLINLRWLVEMEGT